MKVTDFIGEKVIYDKDSQTIFREHDENIHNIIDVRGWNAIINYIKDNNGDVDMDKAAEFQDELGEWIADAINEKIKKCQ